MDKRKDFNKWFDKLAADKGYGQKLPNGETKVLSPKESKEVIIEAYKKVYFRNVG